MLELLQYENKKCSRILMFFLFLVGFSIPFSFAFNSISIGLLFIISFFWFKKSNFYSFFKHPKSIIVIFILFYLLQIIGVLYSENFDIALSNTIKSIVLIIIPITFINISKTLDIKKVTISIYGLIFGVFLMLFSAHINILYKIILEDLPISSFITFFTRVEFVKEAFVEIHPPYFGILVVFILFPVSKIRLLKNKIGNDILIYFLVLYLIFSLYGISSFMSFILLTFFILYKLVYLVKNGIKINAFILITTACTILILVSFFYNKPISDFGGGSLINRINWMLVKGKGDTSRPHNWNSVIDVIQGNLIVGIGSDGGIQQLQIRRDQKSESFINKHNAHNQYLEIFLRHGLLGFFIYMYLLFSLIKKSLRFKNENFKWFLLVFLISSITESYLQRQIGITFFTFYAVLYITFYNFETNNFSITNEKSFGT